jgi:hypothetical protein
VLDRGSTLGSSSANQNRDDRDGFICVVVDFMPPVGISEGFFDPLSKGFFGLFAFALVFFVFLTSLAFTTTDGSKLTELKLVICEVSRASCGHGFV